MIVEATSWSHLHEVSDWEQAPLTELCLTASYNEITGLVDEGRAVDIIYPLIRLSTRVPHNTFIAKEARKFQVWLVSFFFLF